jgi:chromosome segregation ATPase
LDPTIIVITTAAGALFGTAVGILLFRRKMRPPITDGELAQLKARLQAGESSFATASANLEDLRKQISLQEKTLLQNGEDLKKRQQQLETESAETQKEKARAAVLEQNAQELNARLALLTEQCSKLDAQVKEAQSLVADKAAQLASAGAELEAGRQKVQELTGQIAQLTSESVELRRVGEQEARLRALLETQLNAEHERIGQMMLQIAELQRERSQLEIKVQEEGRTAAKGMELLLMAQEKLASAFKALGADSQNGNRSQTTGDAAAVSLEAKTEPPEVAAHSSAA